jgi:hypothetical protein
LNSGDEFARELFEDAKNSLKLAKSKSSETAKQRHLRHSLLAAFSFLELQIELISQHFKESDFFTLHERGIVSQREVVFDRGRFQMTGTARFSRLTDRIHLLQHKFKGSKLTERPWWQKLVGATDRRNAVAHPREPIVLDERQVEQDLLAVLSCANDLFEIVFAKGLPYASLGVKPKVKI